MAKINLEKLNLKELKDLQKNVAKAIKSFEDRQRKDALATIEAKAKELGYSLAELTGGKVSRTPAAAKYRHPENPNLTWTGRGRKPKWFIEALEAGMKPEEMEVR